jgi:hypothetical protein
MVLGLQKPLSAALESRARAEPGDPGGNRLGFHMQTHNHLEIGIDLTPDFYLDYIMTETNVAAAVRGGVRYAEIRSWVRRKLSASVGRQGAGSPFPWILRLHERDEFEPSLTRKADPGFWARQWQLLTKHPETQLAHYT